MMTYKSDFLNILSERGFIHQGSDLQGLDKKLMEGPQSAYIGFDATAKSLHIGNLIGIMMLGWFQKCGHRPVTLMGGGTTKVGDPSGKDEQRRLLSAQAINDNIDGIKKVFNKFLEYGPDKAIMSNNDAWLSTLNYIDFLRDVGKHFSVNRMLAMDSVKLRLEREQPLSFIEFNYMVCQAYDFVELHKRHGTVLQMGGSDQWGNIIQGVELGRRMLNAELFALTTPLLINAAGEKMGKTAGGQTVWLNEEAMSPYDYWQFWRNVEDAKLGELLRKFTFLPMDEIKKLEALGGSEINEAKKMLATEATALCHGREAALAAADTARKTFEEGAAGGELPTITVEAAALAAGILLSKLLVDVGFVKSNGEARRLIEGGGAYVNDNKIEDAAYKCTPDHVGVDGAIKISSGKKKHALIKPAP